MTTFNISYVLTIQTAVSGVIDAGGSVNARNPQPSEIPFTLASVPVCIHERLVHGVGGGAKQLAASAAIAFGQLQYLV